jgi:hypothetical protein
MQPQRKIDDCLPVIASRMRLGHGVEDGAARLIGGGQRYLAFLAAK